MKIAFDKAKSERLFITNEFTNREVHKWRSEESAILVGTKTALLDDPQLNNRLWNGNEPVRIVVDKHLHLPSSLKAFDGKQKTIVFNFVKEEVNENLVFYKLNEDENFVQQIVHACYLQKIQSIIVEGGATLLQSFINENLWDEARIITNTKMQIGTGIDAPILSGSILQKSEDIFGDNIKYFTRINNE